MERDQGTNVSSKELKCRALSFTGCRYYFLAAVHINFQLFGRTTQPKSTIALSGTVEQAKREYSDLTTILLDKDCTDFCTDYLLTSSVSNFGNLKQLCICGSLMETRVNSLRECCFSKSTTSISR